MGLTVLAGCASVLDLDSYQIDKTSSPEGGTCGTVPSGDDAIVRACLLLVGCSPFVPRLSLSDCISFSTPRAFGYEKCLVGARTCTDATRCIGVGLIGTECTTSQSARCSGTRALNCADGYFTDCSVVGGTCTTYTASTGLRAGCRVQSSCSAATGARCAGQSLYTCFNGVGIGQVCSNTRSTCATRSGTTTCWDQGEPCSGAPVSCEGNVAAVCGQSGRFTFDCAAMGLECKMSGEEVYCVAPGCEVARVKECKESCSGSTANLCLGGLKRAIDCTRYGLRTCKSFTDSRANGLGSYVACTP